MCLRKNILTFCEKIRYCHIMLIFWRKICITDFLLSKNANLVKIVTKKNRGLSLCKIDRENSKSAFIKVKKNIHLGQKKIGCKRSLNASILTKKTKFSGPTYPKYFRNFPFLTNRQKFL